MSRKIFGLTLVFVLVLAMTACGPGGTSGARSASVPGQPVEIDMIMRYNGRASHPDNAIWQELSQRLEQMGIIVNIEYFPSTDYSTRQVTVIAAGDFPDMMEWWPTGYPRDLEELSGDGVIMALDNLLDRYGHNIRQIRTEAAGTWYRNTRDGLIYAVPARANDYGNNHIFVVRQAWLDELGLGIPDSPDELYNMLVRFKQRYPDIIPFGHGIQHFPLPTALVLSAYGVTNNQWNINSAGNLEHYSVMDGTKDAIAFIRRLYQEGLMEPEYLLLDRSALWDRFIGGEYGLCAFNTETLDSSTLTMTNLKERNVQISVLNVFPDAHGVRRYPRMISTQQMIIFNGIGDEKASACIRFLDYLYTEEGGDLVDIGIKDTHWIQHPDGSKELIASADEFWEAGRSMYSWIARRSNFLPTIDPFAKQVAAMILESTVENPILTFPAQNAARNSTALGSLVSTSITTMITDRNVNLDTAFPDFVNRWYSSGGREWTDELNMILRERTR